MLEAGLGMKRNTNRALFNNSTAVMHAEGTAGRFGGLPYWFDSANTQFANPNVIDATSKK